MILLVLYLFASLVGLSNPILVLLYVEAKESLLHFKFKSMQSRKHVVSVAGEIAASRVSIMEFSNSCYSSSVDSTKPSPSESSVNISPFPLLLHKGLLHTTLFFALFCFVLLIFVCFESFSFVAKYYDTWFDAGTMPG